MHVHKACSPFIALHFIVAKAIYSVYPIMLSPQFHWCIIIISQDKNQTKHNLYKDEMHHYKTQYNVVKEKWNVCKMFQSTLLFQNLVQAPCIKILYYSKVTLRHTTIQQLVLWLLVATYIKVRTTIMYGRVTNNSRPNVNCNNYATEFTRN